MNIIHTVKLEKDCIIYCILHMGRRGAMVYLDTSAVGSGDCVASLLVSSL